MKDKEICTFWWLKIHFNGLIEKLAHRWKIIGEPIRKCLSYMDVGPQEEHHCPSAPVFQVC